MKKLFLLFILTAAAFAQAPMPDVVLGTRPVAFSARSLGLGRTYLTGEVGPASMMGNPATLANQQTRWRFDISGDVSRTKETRSYPFFDAFDGVLGYNNYALNDHLYSKLDGGLSYKVPVNGLRSFVISAASCSAYRFDYRYHEEVRNRFSSGGIQDMKLGENRLDIDGGLRSVTLGAAASASGPFSVGFSLSLYSGDWTYTKRTVYANPDSVNYNNRVKYEPDGTPAELNLGGSYDLNERVTLGARILLPAGDYKVKYNSLYEHNDTSTVSGTSSVTYPSHFALGVQYRPQNLYRPSLYLETEIHTYSDVDLYNLDDTFEIRAGAEQQIIPGAPVRFGFVYASSPQSDENATSLFTAGIGFHLQKLYGDFGVEIGKLNYTTGDLFPQSLYGETDRTDFDHVETALFRGMVTLRYEL